MGFLDKCTTYADKLAQHANSPSVLVGVGIGLAVLGTAAACKATLEADDILEEANAELEKCNMVAEQFPDKYSEEAHRKDKGIVAVKTGLKLLKAYSPAIILFAGGIGSILCGFNILNKRYLAVIAAYEALDKSYSFYRNGVIAELGEEADKRFRHGIAKKELEVDKFDDEGNPTGKKKKAKVYTEDERGLSPYSYFFMPPCKDYTDNPYYNLKFLKDMEQYFNDKLHIEGHVYLDEVLKALDIPIKTFVEGEYPAEHMVGWLDKDMYGDRCKGNGYISFGIEELYNKLNGSVVPDVIEPVMLLDFNVDGLICGVAGIKVPKHRRINHK